MSMQKMKPRLGRGLSSLISMSSGEPAVEAPPVPPRRHPPAGAVHVELPPPPPPPREEQTAVAPPPPVEIAPPPAESAVGSVREIPLDQIVPNPHQPRRVMNEASIAELAASLKSTGLIQPIVVRKAGDRFELIAGERRWRAARVAGLTTVPALVRQSTSLEQAQMALVENIQRENLNPIDRALAYRTLLTQLGLTQAELANRTGEDRSSVANFLRLLDLAEPVQAMVVDGRLSMGHAKILAGVQSHAEQERLANLVVGQSLSVRNLERQLQETPTLKPAPAAVSPHLADLEKSITQQLGLRVQVKSGANKKGKLIVHYASLDQFDELLGRLGVKVES